MASHLPHSSKTATGEPLNPRGGIELDVQAEDIGVVCGGVNQILERSMWGGLTV